MTRRDVSFEFQLKFWNTASIGILVRSLLICKIFSTLFYYNSASKKFGNIMSLSEYVMGEFLSGRSHFFQEYFGFKLSILIQAV